MKGREGSNREALLYTTVHMHTYNTRYMYIISNGSGNGLKCLAYMAVTCIYNNDPILYA